MNFTTPLHPRARELFETDLYSGISNFGELEDRISCLVDNQTKGDAFEIFAEAYLVTQRKHDADTVWPHDAIPSELLRELGLTELDYGVDGVLQTLLGDYNAFQVKFRSKRTPLTWKELSTFVGLADSQKIHSRILLTNSDEVPELLNDRRGFFCIRGSDLDRLQPEDFQEIEAWLAGAAVETEKKTPKKHQKEALAALVPALEAEDRVSAIMACGTGKTLVTLWVAERLQSSRVLVLLPSLALLRQTLHEWLQETNLDALTYLCVCSDRSVAKALDTLATKQSDLDFEVGTDPNNVRRFLDAEFTGTKVVFSTYQSARVVGAAMKAGEAFDLGIFDEAHKTAGREGRNFGFALDDSNLPIRKRLFVTATPRHYNPHKRDGDDEAEVVYSMDNPQVYGSQAFRLTFGEAAERDIICNYRVVISVITSETVTNEMISRGDVIVEGDLVRARQVANQIALCDAVEKYGVRKIFTFHKTVKSAASFVAEGGEGVGTHLEDFGSFHVNGGMPTFRRERIMKEFRAMDKAVISNARCLTEGVDVPAVDMVAFLSPRRSRVDIVQATGRAMRRSSKKTLGYVLIPLYVDLQTGESVDAAVARSDFSEVWDVLQSLQEQDEVLADMIRNAAEMIGRGKGFDDQAFADRIDFDGYSLSLGNLRAAIATRCVEELSSSWDKHFGKLAEFRKRFGHCNVVTGWEEDPSLAGWVVAQRTRHKVGNLSDTRVRRLDEIGFVWDYQAQKAQETWDNYFAELEDFMGRRFKHCNVATGWEENPSLAGWVSSQRVKHKKGDLSDDQIRRLNELGFVWDFQAEKSRETWLKWYRELEAYSQRHGNADVPRTNSNTKLASWVWIQRIRKNKPYGVQRILNVEEIELLDRLNFSWDRRTTQWTQNLAGFKRLVAENGNDGVEADRTGIGDWVKRQRKLQSEGQLPDERKVLLDEAGFEWQGNSITDRRWLAKYNRLKLYFQENGNSDVPNRWKNDPSLANWVSSQRERQKNEVLPEDRVRMLDALDFTWQSRDVGTWEDRLAEVAAFKAEHGHCDIPTNFHENPKLGRFVNNMRSKMSNGELPAERIEKLEALGFKWALRAAEVSVSGKKVSAAWKTRFDELLAYKDAHGDCNVPRKWAENEQLGVWVSQQRQDKKRGKLDSGKRTLLDSIGFIWDLGPGVKRKTWEERFADLLEYGDAHGNCDVPIRYADDPQLGTWVSNQRSNKKKGKLTPEHEQKLNDVGFSWEKRPSKGDAP